MLLRREEQPDQPAHGGADPVYFSLHVVVADRSGGACQHRGGVVLVGREGVLGLVVEPFALAASGDVHADDAAFGRQRGGEIVEVAAVARKAMHAEHDMRIADMAPVGVGDAMKAAVAESLEISLLHGTMLAARNMSRVDASDQESYTSRASHRRSRAARRESAPPRPSRDRARP